MDDTTYTALRHFADSWGLLFMFLFFCGVIAWVLRPGAARTYELLDGGLMMAVCALPMLAGWTLSQKKNKPRKHEGVHGTARHAQRADLEAARLLPARAGIQPRRPDRQPVISASRASATRMPSRAALRRPSSRRDPGRRAPG